MYIKSFEYCDSASEWQLERLTLDNPLTLLVGISGVGKTRILRALLNLKAIANGESLNGVKWLIEFTIDSAHHYHWEGEFENQGFYPLESIFEKEDENRERPKIIYEKLTLNDEEILNRNKTGIFFKEKQTVQLPRHQSIIELLKEEKEITPVNQSFDKIYFGDYDVHPFFAFSARSRISKTLLEKYQSLESIRESQQGIKTKLYLAYLNAQDVFESIKSDFIAIFPYVEDLKIEPFKEESEIGSFLSKIPFIQIKEKGVAHWIHQGQMSAGMFRSLMHIAEIYLCAEGSVLLIDEFENSLGANCIDEMMDYLTSHERNLQLIITSHHPYIINRIPFKFWKLVTRASGKVVTRNATEFNLGKSKHEAFLQLINLDEYNEGIVT